MYRAGDSAQHWKASFYFTTMIFFLAWMVRNVFIAVITETFNEIRVQFQEMWGDRERITGETSTQVLEGDHKAWKLVTVYENRHSGWAPAFCQRFLRSPFYHVIIILVTLANAIVTASISFKHTPDPHTSREHFFKHQRRLEIGFTFFYDIEVIFKVFCLGFTGFISR